MPSRADLLANLIEAARDTERTRNASSTLKVVDAYKGSPPVVGDDSKLLFHTTTVPRLKQIAQSRQLISGDRLQHGPNWAGYKELEDHSRGRVFLSERPGYWWDYLRKRDNLGDDRFNLGYLAVEDPRLIPNHEWVTSGVVAAYFQPDGTIVNGFDNGKISMQGGGEAGFRKFQETRDRWAMEPEYREMLAMAQDDYGWTPSSYVPKPGQPIIRPDRMANDSTDNYIESPRMKLDIPPEVMEKIAKFGILAPLLAPLAQEGQANAQSR